MPFRLGRRRAQPEPLAPYTPRRRIGLITQLFLLVLLFAFCWLYGSAFAFVAPYLLAPFAIPILVLAGLILWVLPETRRPPVRLLEFLFFLFFVTLCMWPNYLAVAISGLPRMGPLRITAVAMALTFLICTSVSATFRARISEILRVSPVLWKCVVAFTVIQALSIGFSGNTAGSLNLFFTYLTNCTVLFFIGSVLFAKRGMPELFAVLLCAMAIGLSGIAAWEILVDRVPWSGHIPAFLQIDDPVVERILSGGSRNGHRAQATFVTSLTLSEFLALTMPFCLHFALQRYSRLIRITAGIAAPVILVATILTQSRTGILGLLVTGILFPLALAITRWRHNRGSFILSSALYLAPVFMPVAAVIGYLTPGIRIRLVGGGASQLSTQSRWDQLALGIPKVFKHPWGYGIGQGAQTLGYTNMEGLLTIDSYPLRQSLEYGMVGVALYYIQYFSALFYVAKASIAAPNDDLEAQLLIPVGVNLISFTAMQINFAQGDNEPIMYALLGMAAALFYRYGTSLSFKQIWTGNKAAAAAESMKPRLVPVRGLSVR